jgi:GNAT superfamily N-acetyltransferase
MLTRQQRDPLVRGMVMAEITVHDMRVGDEYFVATCSHVHESQEHDACGRRRLAWLHAMHDRGLRALVAQLDGQPAGFAYVMPIEVSPWGPLGRDVMVLNCLFVLLPSQHKGIGHALLAAAEDETRRQGRKALVTTAYYHDFWFMPATFFEACGFTAAARKDTRAILWKVFDPTAQPPELLERQQRFEPVSGKVVVELFWHTFCLTSNVEAQRVRQVAAEFGDRVVLREYCADNPEVLRKYQTPRAIYVNGREIGWGYAAPKDGIRAAIRDALTAFA